MGRGRSRKAIDFPIPASEHGSDMVTVVVGEKTEWPARTFTLHKNLLCHASDYFDRALNGPFLEGQKSELILADDCPAAFEVLYHWVYTGFFYQDKTFQPSQRRLTPDYEMEYETYWLESYKFAECRLLPRMQDWAMSQLYDAYNNPDIYLPSTDFIERLFTPESGSALFQEFFIAYTAFWLADLSVEKNLDNWKEFLQACGGRLAMEVSLKLAEWNAVPDPIGGRCHPCREPRFQLARAEARRFGISPPESPESELSTPEPELTNDSIEQVEVLK